MRGNWEFGEEETLTYESNYYFKLFTKYSNIEVLLLNNLEISFKKENAQIWNNHRYFVF